MLHACCIAIQPGSWQNSRGDGVLNLIHVDARQVYVHKVMMTAINDHLIVGSTCIWHHRLYDRRGGIWHGPFIMRIPRSPAWRGGWPHRSSVKRSLVTSMTGGLRSQTTLPRTLSALWRWDAGIISLPAPTPRSQLHKGIGTLNALK
jgi:hypothetical protein